MLCTASTSNVALHSLEPYRTVVGRTTSGSVLAFIVLYSDSEAVHERVVTVAVENLFDVESPPRKLEIANYPARRLCVFTGPSKIWFIWPAHALLGPSVIPADEAGIVQVFRS